MSHNRGPHMPSRERPANVERSTRPAILAFLLVGVVILTWVAVFVCPMRVAPLSFAAARPTHCGRPLCSAWVSVSELAGTNRAAQLVLRVPPYTLDRIRGLQSRGVERLSVTAFFRVLPDDALCAASLEECVARYCELTGLRHVGVLPEAAGYGVTLDTTDMTASEQASMIRSLLGSMFELVAVGEDGVRVVSREQSGEPK